MQLAAEAVQMRRIDRIIRRRRLWLRFAARDSRRATHNLKNINLDLPRNR
jgi:hypothetical protein